MSNLNNVYGDSNGCPPIMNDGRGVKTSYLNNKELTEKLRNQLNVQNTLDFRLRLQQEGKEIVDGQSFLDINEFRCTNDPSGEVVLSKEFSLATVGGSYKDQFKRSLNPNDN